MKSIYHTLWIIIILALVSIIWIFWYNWDTIITKIQAPLQESLMDEWIIVKKSVSWIRTWLYYDIWWIWENISWKEINIFSRSKSSKITNLVIEDTQIYNNEWIQNILNFKGNYKIIKGQWYHRIFGGVKWP